MRASAISWVAQLVVNPDSGEEEASPEAMAVRLDVPAEAAIPDPDALGLVAILDRDVLAEAAILDRDVRHSDGHTPDLPVAVVQSLDPLVEMVQLVAKFPVGERWEELLSQEVLVNPDRAVRLQVFRNLDRLDVQGSANLDRAVRVVKAIPDRGDRVEHRYRQMEGRCNTRFLF